MVWFPFLAASGMKPRRESIHGDCWKILEVRLSWECPANLGPPHLWRKQQAAEVRPGLVVCRGVPAEGGGSHRRFRAEEGTDQSQA